MSLAALKRDVLRPVKNNGRRRRLSKDMDKMMTRRGDKPASLKLSESFERARAEAEEGKYIPNRRERRRV